MDGISSCSTWSFHGTMSWMPDLKWTQIQKEGFVRLAQKRNAQRVWGMNWDAWVVLSSLRDFKSAIEHVAAVGHGDVISDTFQLQRNSNPGEKILWELFRSIYSSQRIRKRWKMNHVYLWTVLLWDSFSSFSQKKASANWRSTPSAELDPSRARRATGALLLGKGKPGTSSFLGAQKLRRWIFWGGKNSSESQAFQLSEGPPGHVA